MVGDDERTRNITGEAAPGQAGEEQHKLPSAPHSMLVGENGFGSLLRSMSARDLNRCTYHALAQNMYSPVNALQDGHHAPVSYTHAAGTIFTPDFN